MTVTIGSPAELLTGTIIERDLDVAIPDPLRRLDIFQPRGVGGGEPAVSSDPSIDTFIPCQDPGGGGGGGESVPGMIECAVSLDPSDCGGGGGAGDTEGVVCYVSQNPADCGGGGGGGEGESVPGMIACAITLDSSDPASCGTGPDPGWEGGESESES